MADNLLQEVRDECGITWVDDDTDRKLIGIMNNARAYLDRRAGEPCAYEDGLDRMLFRCACRYIYNKCFENFTEHFAEELLAFREKYVAKRELEREAVESEAE